MTHIESLQPRELFAVAEIRDATFGDNGTAKLPSYISINGITATHGAIYVDVYNSRKDRRLVYKYTDAGTLDTTWGNGGYLVPRVIEQKKGIALDHFTPLNITYDARTGGLLLGFVNQNAVHIERRLADGMPDYSWSNGGVYEFRRTGIDFTLNAVTPLSGKRLLFALTGTHSTETTAGNVTRTAAESDIALVRLDRFARPDKTFSKDGFVTVASGTSAGIRTPSSDITGVDEQNRNVPTFGDLVFAADGNYRVVATRERTTATVNYDSGFDGDLNNTGSGHSSFSAESIRVTVDGNTVTPQSMLLKRIDYSGTFTDTTMLVGPYRPKLATAEGDDGAVVLANLGFGGNSVLHVRPGYRSANASLPSSDPYVFEVFRNASGETFVETTGGVGKPTVARYNPDLTLDRAFGTNGVYTESTAYIEHAADDAGRLIVAFSGKNELYRLL